MYQDENKRLHLTFRDLNLSENESRIITGNRCDALLDMRCIMDGGETEIIYSAEKYVRLDEFFRTGVSTAEDILMTVAEIFRMIDVCRDHLIMYGEVPLEADRIFCGKSGREIRFMYIPGYRRESGVRESVVELIDLAEESAVNVEADMYEKLAGFKNKLFSAEGSMESLASVAEEYIRGYSSLEKAGAVNMTAIAKVNEENESAEYETNALALSTVLKPEKKQKNSKSPKSSNSGAGGITHKIKNFIDELVS